MESLGHAWNIGLLDYVILISSGGCTSEAVVKMGLTLQVVGTTSTAVVSSVSGTVVAELNSTVALCRNALRFPGEGERQETTFMVFGEQN